MTSDIQWYIARDGKQYGPLSDPEMGLFVKGGHLRGEDLVWRPGFNDWLPAAVAFPPNAAPAPVPSQPQPVAQPTGPRAQTDPRTGPGPVQAAGQAQGYGAGPTIPSASAATTGAPYGQPQGQAGPPRPQTTGGGAGPARTVAPGPRGPGPAHPSHAAARPTASDTTRGTTNTAQGADPRAAGTAGRAVVPVDAGYSDDETGADAKPPSRLGRVAAVAAVLAITVGGAWLAYQNRDDLKTIVSGMIGGTGGKSVDPNAPAFVVSGGAADAIDARLQRTTLWSVVKREFPDWYGERLAETAKLTAEKKPDSAVTKHLIEALVALRRKHANDALAASSSRLINIADAFLANLKRISATSTTTCYSFISQGEASPAIVELVHKQGGDAHLQAQVTAIFEAIAEGRKSPVKYATPDKADYDALAEQLTKLGWSQADLQLFADPRALARTSHDRVCKMVQDWFSAHISVKDRSAQERLLIETLRPVVAG